MTIDTNQSIACTLTTAELAARRNQLAQTLFTQVTHTIELVDGYQFDFAGDGHTADSLLEFIKFERICCAFIHFELIFTPPHNTISLQLRGGEEVKGFIESELQGVLS